MAHPPTVRSLAKLAGVSIATVSLALRDNPRIRQSERERIQKLAAEAGYEPNAMIANFFAQIRFGKTSAHQGTLGLVYATKSPAELISVMTYQQWFAACKARSAQLGYCLDEFMLYEPGMSPARLVEILDARGIVGLVVVGPFPQSFIPPKFDPIWLRSAAVVIGGRPVRPALSCSANDQFSTSKHAVGALCDLGYRRPGLCIDPEIDAYVEGRFQGGFGVAQERLLKRDRLPVFGFRPFDKERFVCWMERYRPDSIITLHFEVKEWIEEMGLTVPEDVGLVHLDRVPNLKEWTGMRQNNEGVGAAAVDMVIGQLHRNEIGIPPFQKCTFTNSAWIPGTTVRKLDGPPSIKGLISLGSKLK